MESEEMAIAIPIVGLVRKICGRPTKWVPRYALFPNAPFTVSLSEFE